MMYMMSYDKYISMSFKKLVIPFNVTILNPDHKNHFPDKIAWQLQEKPTTVGLTFNDKRRIEDNTFAIFTPMRLAGFNLGNFVCVKSAKLVFIIFSSILLLQVFGKYSM